MKKIVWTEGKIKDGFNKFFSSYHRYPTALEIDQFGLLPSSRQIQRRFGGLKKLRKLLGLPENSLDFSRGKNRSEIAVKVGKRGIDHERSFYDFLVNKFGEVFVHTQKKFDNFRRRIDFFIYCKGYKFGIDTFFADNFHNFIGCINIKEKTYKNADFDIILLSTSFVITQLKINNFLINKKNKLPNNIKIMTIETFKSFVKSLEPYQFKLDR